MNDNVMNLYEERMREKAEIPCSYGGISFGSIGRKKERISEAKRTFCDIKLCVVMYLHITWFARYGHKTCVKKHKPMCDAATRSWLYLKRTFLNCILTIFVLEN